MKQSAQDKFQQLSLSRKGVAFFVVLSVVSVMGIFILFYHSFSKQFATSNFYHVNRDKLKNISDVIMSSTFVYIQNETRDASSILTKEIISQMKSGSSGRPKLTLKAPMFENVKEQLLNGLAIDYVIKGIVFDKRTRNPKGHLYHNGEGLGTLEITLTANLTTSSGKVLAACSRKRHFDFKSSCLVSNYNNRANSYAMTFPLDYSLLIRDARREYNERPNGQNFNFGTKFTITDQSSNTKDKRGWIYFGNANSNKTNNRIALNISDAPESSKLLPSLLTSKFEINQDDCYKLIPSIKKSLDKENATFSGLKGYFKYYVFPAFRATESANEKSQITQNNLEAASNGTVYKTKAPAITFNGPQTEDYLQSIIRGAVTKRFLYMVHFVLDPSQTKISSKGKTENLAAKGKLALINKGNFICYSPDSNFLKIPSIKDRQEHIRCAKAVAEIQQRRSPPLPLFSEMKENNLCFEGQNIEKKANAGKIFGTEPNFFSRNGARLSSIAVTGGEGFRPFRHCTLYAARFYYAKDLETSGIYDKKNGILNLRGIVSVELDPVILTPPPGKSSIIIKGQGAILAPNGFSIRAGIKLNDPTKDMCMLFTRKGNIKITTSQPIAAALMAFNDTNSGSISAFKPLDIHGSIGVDRLYSSQLPNSASKITYDTRFKVNQDSKEIFSVTISPWIRFEHISYSRNRINAT